MIPIHGLFESHLTVRDLSVAMAFYGRQLGLTLAESIPERKVAFYWTGPPGSSMLGLWEVGTAPSRMSLHIALRVSLDDLDGAAGRLRDAGIVPLDFWGRPTEEPIVIGWMPAASLYFNDVDGHLLEFIAMLDEPSRPEVGIIPWSDWRSRYGSKA